MRSLRGNNPALRINSHALCDNSHALCENTHMLLGNNDSCVTILMHCAKKKHVSHGIIHVLTIKNRALRHLSFWTTVVYYRLATQEIAQQTMYCPPRDLYGIVSHSIKTLLDTCLYSIFLQEIITGGNIIPRINTG